MTKRSVAALAILLATSQAHAQETRRTEGVIYRSTTAPTAARDLRVGDFWVDIDSSPVDLYILTALTPTWVRVSTSSGIGHVIQDEGTPLASRAALDFAGAGVTCADSGGVKTLCTIPGGGGGNNDLLDGSVHQDTEAKTVQLGDLIVGYDLTSLKWTTLPGNNTATKMFLTQTGDGFFSAVPAWDTIDLADAMGSAPASADQVYVSTSSSGGIWRALPDCDDTGGNHLNYDTTTDLFSCGTSGGGGSSHALLSATHTDTIAASPVAGDMIFADGSAVWQRLAVGGADQVLSVQAGIFDVPSWKTPDWTYAEIQNVAASRLLGNATGSAAAVAEIDVTTPLGFVGGTTLRLTAIPINLGGTTETVSTEDAVLVGGGAADWVPKVIPDCDLINQSLQYDVTGNTFTCRTLRTILVSTGAPTDAVIATYTAIPSIAFTPAANTRYRIECMIIFTSTVATTGINFAWDVPAAVNFIHMTGHTTSTALGAVEGFSQRADNVGTPNANTVVTVQNIAYLNAILSNGANATSTTLGFTPETANSVAVIAGSVCEYWIY